MSNSGHEFSRQQGRRNDEKYGGQQYGGPVPITDMDRVLLALGRIEAKLDKLLLDRSQE